MLTIVAFILSILVFIPALLIFIASVFNIPETHPLASVFFLVILVSTLPEMPLHNLSLKTGFPVVLPSLSIILAAVAVIRREHRKGLLITGTALIILSIVLYLIVHHVLD